MSVLKSWYDDLANKPDCIVLLQPTHPLRQPADLSDAIAQFVDSDLDSMFALAPTDLLLGELKNGVFHPEYSLPRNKRSEPKRYRNTGSFYLLKPERTFMTTQNYGVKHGGYVLRAAEIEIDIDYPHDLLLAEAMLKTHQRDMRHFEHP